MQNNENTKKRKNAPIIFIGALTALFALWYYNNFTIKTVYTEITSDKVQNDVKIALISDLHGMKFGEDNKNLIETIDAQKPDIVVACGDMMTSTEPEETIPVAVELLSDLAEKYPVYFVDGEHDKLFESLHTALQDTNVTFTPMYDVENYYNISCFEDTITVGETEIYIGGVNYYSHFYFDMNEYITIPDDVFSIFLCHIPQIEEFEKIGADLTLSGDTHGGIIQLFGPAYFEGEWFPELTGSNTPVYDKGLFDYEGGQMYVTSGLGAYPIPARFNNRPEVCFITIRPE